MFFAWLIDFNTVERLRIFERTCIIKWREEGWNEFIGNLDFLLCFNFVRRASDKCQKEKRKTINGDDLLWAMATLGFEDYIDPLKAYLSRYREVIGFVVAFLATSGLFILLLWLQQAS